MDRRNLLGPAALSAAAPAAPALAQSAMPEVRWRAASSYTRGFDVVYGTMERTRCTASLADASWHSTRDMARLPGGSAFRGLWESE